MADEIHLPFGQIKVVVCFSFHLTIFTRESRNSIFGGKNTSRGGHAGASLLPRQSRWDWNRLIVSQKSRKAEWKSLTTFLWLKMETNFSKMKSEIFLREREREDFDRKLNFVAGRLSSSQIVNLNCLNLWRTFTENLLSRNKEYFLRMKRELKVFRGMKVKMRKIIENCFSLWNWREKNFSNRGGNLIAFLFKYKSNSIKIFQKKTFCFRFWSCSVSPQISFLLAYSNLTLIQPSNKICIFNFSQCLWSFSWLEKCESSSKTITKENFEFWGKIMENRVFSSTPSMNAKNFSWSEK